MDLCPERRGWEDARERVGQTSESSIRKKKEKKNSSGHWSRTNVCDLVRTNLFKAPRSRKKKENLAKIATSKIGYF